MAAPKRYPIHVLTNLEVEALVEAAGECTSGIRNAALVAFLYATGLRISEALALRPIHLEAGADGATRVHVERGKGGRPGRSLMLGDTWAFDRWLRVRRELGLGDADLLFCTISSGDVQAVGSPLDRSWANRMVKRLAARAGIAKRVWSHGIRHSHAVRLYQVGAPQAAIQDQLRHGDPETTRRYLRDLGCIDSASVLLGLDF